MRIEFSGNKVFSDLKIDDSISINGVCQTITSIKNYIATVEAVEETIERTTFKNLKILQKVNLERAMLPSTRMGGHIVQGHIDTTGKVIDIKHLTASTLFNIEFPTKYHNYLVDKGSICIDGVSLTVSEVKENSFLLSIIPHTIKNTIISEYKIGQIVNLEFDILGKYIEKNLNYFIDNKQFNSSNSILNKYIDQPEF